MVNSTSSSGTPSTDSSSMTGASVAHAIASLAHSGSPQDRHKFSHMQQFSDRREAFDPAANRHTDSSAPTILSARVGSSSAAPKKRSTKSKCSPGLRSGKWTPEEEAFTNMTIHFFKRGLLDVEDGTSLRWYLAKRLNCEAMRVTKKLKGNSSIGKQIFRAMENTPANRQAIRRAREELAVVEARFIESLTNSGNTVGVPLPSSLVVSVRGRKILPNPPPKTRSSDGKMLLAPMPSGTDETGTKPLPKPEDAKLLLHFFSEAHDGDEEPEGENKTEDNASEKKSKGAGPNEADKKTNGTTVAEKEADQKTKDITVAEKEAKDTNLSVDLSDKLGKKRPLSSISAPADNGQNAKPEEEDPVSPSSKRQNVTEV
ncbi:hypothetical protein PHYBOEH_003294 [Phytophthora boehmeriae]|uniref:Uncharacterized protein n=1 Tax=Phytophthora boehmeriae TaxID=109152 RepID=A0A8T1WQJ5_9STRA|nr:hypothetical protein PHYBOEH_003294 [Phytophthora boehmeriae]